MDSWGFVDLALTPLSCYPWDFRAGAVRHEDANPSDSDGQLKNGVVHSPFLSHVCTMDE